MEGLSQTCCTAVDYRCLHWLYRDLYLKLTVHRSFIKPHSGGKSADLETTNNKAFDCRLDGEWWSRGFCLRCCGCHGCHCTVAITTTELLYVHRYTSCSCVSAAEPFCVVMCREKNRKTQDILFVLLSWLVLELCFGKMNLFPSIRNAGTPSAVFSRANLMLNIWDISFLAARRFLAFLYLSVCCCRSAGTTYQHNQQTAALQRPFERHKFQSREIKPTVCCCADKESDTFKYFKPRTELYYRWLVIFLPTESFQPQQTFQQTARLCSRCSFFNSCAYWRTWMCVVLVLVV